MIYLDNAATTSPKPQNVKNSVSFALQNYCANPGRSGHTLSENCAEMIYNTRSKVADFFGVSTPEKVVFTQNCTQSLNILINGLFKAGDHIIISCYEHNAVSRPTFAFSKKGGSFDVAYVYDDDEQTVKSFKSKIKRNTKAIICTHASNVFGKKLPIERLGKLCREYGLLMIVDAAQTAGVVDINCEKMNIDYLCIAPHKGLYAPMGVGILVTDNKPEPFVLGGTGSVSVDLNQPDFTPDKYESGTVNVPAIAGISAGIDFVKKSKVLYDHELRLVTAVYDELKNNEKIRFYHHRPDRSYVPVISFNISDVSSEKVAARLNDFGIAVRAGLHCAPMAHYYMGTQKQGTVRVCPSVFTMDSDIEKFISVTNKIAKEF
ncbi:MAG: aminotransferase class V-fold PLP-dependent enzyme [Clostridia bacterium]|nr:aminotransferase class V-fold PLP-dependent enzyme [Clostridia bacterium]